MSAVKVFFRLVQDEDGHPPASVESLWAEDLGGGRARLDNIPFFARDVAHRDVVLTETDVDGRPWFVAVVEDGGHGSVRVIVADEKDVPAFRAECALRGCDTELSHVECMFAVDVPPSAQWPSLRDWLVARESRGALSFEESKLPME